MSTQTAISPWLARQARRSALLVWWTLTLQLPKRFILWRRARQLRRLPPITLDLQPVLIRGRDPKQIRIPQSDRSDRFRHHYQLRQGRVHAVLPRIDRGPSTKGSDRGHRGGRCYTRRFDRLPRGSARHSPHRQPDQPRLSTLLQHCRACRQWQVPAAAQQRHAGDAGLARSASGAVRITGRHRRGRLQASVSRWQAAGGRVHRLG